MFSEIKTYAAVLGVAIVLAVLGYLGYTYDSTQKENKTLQTQVTVQKVEIKDQATTIEVQQKSGAATEQVVTEHASEGRQVDQKFAAIKKKQQAKIQEIERTLPVAPAAPASSATAALPPVSAASAAALPDGVSAKDAAISAVRINSLWEGYCVAAPEAAECKDAASKP